MNKLSLLTIVLCIVVATPALASRREAEQTACMNRCESYRVFCNSDVQRQAYEMSQSEPRNCPMMQELDLSLKACAAATKDCQRSCFSRPSR